MSNRSLLAIAVLAIAPQLAWAHAHVKQSSPAKDAVVSASPTAVTLTLTEGLEPAFSSLTLVDASGQPVPTGKSAPAPGDDKTLVLPVTARLANGLYTVYWQVLSKDGHKTKGAWSFTVKP